MHEWIEKLKVGDEIILASSYGSAIVTVSKINKATIEVNGNRLFNKNSGRARGGSGFGTPYLVETTPEKLAAIKDKHLNLRLKDYIINVLKRDVNTEILQKISELLK